MASVASVVETVGSTIKILELVAAGLPKLRGLFKKRQSLELLERITVTVTDLKAIRTAAIRHAKALSYHSTLNQMSSMLDKATEHLNAHVVAFQQKRGRHVREDANYLVNVLDEAHREVSRAQRHYENELLGLIVAAQFIELRAKREIGQIQELLRGYQASSSSLMEELSTLRTETSSLLVHERVPSDIPVPPRVYGPLVGDLWKLLSPLNQVKAIIIESVASEFVLPDGEAP